MRPWICQEFLGTGATGNHHDGRRAGATVRLGGYDFATQIEGLNEQYATAIAKGYPAMPRRSASRWRKSPPPTNSSASPTSSKPLRTGSHPQEALRIDETRRKRKCPPPCGDTQRLPTRSPSPSGLIVVMSVASTWCSPPRAAGGRTSKTPSGAQPVSAIRTLPLLLTRLYRAVAGRLP